MRSLFRLGRTSQSGTMSVETIEHILKQADELGTEESNAQAVTGQIPAGESAVLYRGRAAEKLAMRAEPEPWTQFKECPWEELRYPERVHVDVFGNMHVCQGISMGNLLEKPRTSIHYPGSAKTCLLCRLNIQSLAFKYRGKSISNFPMHRGRCV